MKRHLTPNDIANTVRMMRPLFTGSVVLVEGDSDARVYGKFIDDERCRIIPSFGKSNVTIAMGILEREEHPGVAAVIDSDFMELDGAGTGSDNIIATDTHDLETMIIQSGALDTILAEFGSPPRMKKLKHPVAETLARASAPLGYLRWISSSKQDNLSLRFKHLPFGAIVEAGEGELRIDMDAMLGIVQEQSRVTLDRKALKKRILDLMHAGAHDLWHVGRGHDMVHILAIGIQRVFGNRHARQVSYDEIDRILRISYGYLQFSKSALFAALRAWEKRNPPYTILAGPV